MERLGDTELPQGNRASSMGAGVGDKRPGPTVPPTPLPGLGENLHSGESSDLIQLNPILFLCPSRVAFLMA